MNYAELGWHKVSITEEEKELCAKYGKARTAFQSNTPDIPAYQNQNFKVTGWRQDAFGVLSELGVVKFLGLPTFDLDTWCFYTEDRSAYKRPEIAGVVEVRRVTVPHNPLRVYAKDAEAKSINVQTYVPVDRAGRMTECAVWVCGWVEAAGAWEKRSLPDMALVYPGRLNSPNSLPAAFAAVV